MIRGASLHRSLSSTTVAIAIALPAAAQQVSDTSFNPRITQPAYAEGRGPVVLIDEAHENFHTAEGRYLAFARLLRRDGYVVRSNKARLTKAALDGARILVIANALHERNRDDWDLPTPSAFTPEEITAIREWVAAGGSLLLIADHMPFPGAVDHLAAAFGIFFVNGFAQDSTKEDGSLVFRRTTGSLGAHAIVNGRSPAERVDSVTSFTGSAFRTTASVDTLLRLPPSTIVLMPQVAWQFSRLTPRIAGAGLLQGAAIIHGRGRVAVFGEAAMFSAQVAGPQRRPMGMNDPAAPQNAQFLLNAIHWLSGAL
ncbi:MAG TPA: DUF4350 domain-containing protein [Gemmatimonadaceae bacterium]|nr:DUF4350 domain-containing protein [Gemmatimonadaceae bacterium]